MQNRYDDRSRQDGDFRREDDVSWNDRTGGRGEEGRSWAGSGRDVQRSEGYGGRNAGQHGRQDYGRSEMRGEPMSDRGSFDRYGYGNQPYGGRQSGPDDWRSPGAFAQGPGAPAGEFGRDYGVNRAYGQSQGRYGQGGGYGQGQGHGGYPDHGYAPGGQIWEGQGGQTSGGRQDFEPDYLHWREQQMSKFDRDYDEWRSERRQKFSSDFDTWRSSRAENPVVGDVSDGGVGSQKDAKKD